MGRFKKYNIKPKFYTLVVKPNFGCSTKYIYSNVSRFKKSEFNYPKKLMFKTEYLSGLKNELEKIAFDKYPKLKKIKSFLLTMPSSVFVRMTGSGSSIVAYFYSKKALDIAARKFRKKFNNYWFISSKTI